MDPKTSGSLTQARGAAERVAERVAGETVGDVGLELRGRVDELKGKAVEGYGWAVDQAERLSQDLPEEFREVADRGVDFARRKPLVTTGIIAGVVALLLGAARSRR
ncbi:MAG: CsbD family protein [Caulobacterales bacterium]|nr:CsbD family protein [Caulobacterales bacterium]